ncbi:MAG TPA: hypothetical protein VN193_12960 [Candidatus Angelobacter sp.]|jgi:hypothetical protein|nr:hypothetical protein [Candidatus Angelobacter sp.]
MPRFAFAVPVLPGKDAGSVPTVFAGRMEEYEESRRRMGLSVERAYEMPTPMGNFVIAYMESEHDFAQTLGAVGRSDLAIDRDFAAALKDVHGMDTSQPPPGPAPEVISDWHDPDVKERRRGYAFVAPLAPGRSDAARAFAREAWVDRRAEGAESRRALGITQETAVLNSTPDGDVVCVYIEGVDPAGGFRGFSASQTPYDRWFKDQLKTLFPPQVDFDQPLPPIRTLWEWHRSPVTA